MAFVTLPPDHQDADLAVASSLASLLELEELYVFVTVAPRDEEPAESGTVRRIADAVDGVLDRIADALAAAPQPKIGKLRRLASRSTPA